MFSAEWIFMLRTMAVWERDKRFVVLKIINMMVYLTPIFVFFFQKFIPSMGECLIPWGIEYANTKVRSTVIVVYCVLVVGGLGRYLELELKYELELTACLSMHTLSDTLVCVLYRTFKSHGGWKIENRLVRSLVHHNLLYFSCNFGSCPNHSDVYPLAKWHSLLSWRHPGYNLPSGESLCALKAASLMRVVFGDAHDCRDSSRCSISHGHANA
ncbi:hypothetical protein BDR06DRAFT_715868 [Suillus hirtellus]|nr:hypothetical protein BDR06DRAFT_715868 [Suillus hirtellus]